MRKITNIEERYKKSKKLGEGTFGTVYAAKHRTANVPAALKIIKKDKVNSHKVYQTLMQGELQIIENTSHPYIMRVYELLEDDNNYYIASEYLKYGELYDYVVENGNTLA